MIVSLFECCFVCGRVRRGQTAERKAFSERGRGLRDSLGRTAVHQSRSGVAAGAGTRLSYLPERAHADTAGALSELGCRGRGGGLARRTIVTVTTGSPQP